MCGIFAYLNYGTPKSRKEITAFLINGLKRLEYRGYDSAGKYRSFIFRRFLQFLVTQFSVLNPLSFDTLLANIETNFFDLDE